MTARQDRRRWEREIANRAQRPYRVWHNQAQLERARRAAAAVLRFRPPRAVVPGADEREAA